MADETPKDEKTEEATPKRRSESREKGQVSFSTEVMGAIMLTVVALSFIYAGLDLLEVGCAGVVRMIRVMGEMAREELEVADFAALINDTVDNLLPTFMMIILPMILAGVIAGFAQAGVQLAPKAVSFDPNKINPIKGFQKLFSMRSLVRGVLSAAKIILIFLAFVIVAVRQVEDVSELIGVDAGPALLGALTVVGRCAVAGMLVVAALALIDYLYQRHQQDVDQRMSKKEIKDEMKSIEGDPHIKSRIRQVQREMASKRMMADVPDATVVVTNPTHFAVAIAYQRDASGEEAPRVVAKGVDLVAQKIKAVAREAGVPCYEDRPLARALHAQVEIGDPVPEDLFRAVATVLAYVYRLEGNKAPALGIA